MNKKRLLSLLDWLTEEPNPERITQPESEVLILKRSQAQEYLRTRSLKWRDRRNQNALKDPSGANEGSAS